jgi:hypothetical protein
VLSILGQTESTTHRRGDSGEQAKEKKFPGWGAGLFIQRAWHAWPCAEPTPSLSVIDTPSSAACAHLSHSAWSFPSTSRPRLWKGFSPQCARPFPLDPQCITHNILRYGGISTGQTAFAHLQVREVLCLLYTSCVYFVTTCTKYSSQLLQSKDNCHVSWRHRGVGRGVQRKGTTAAGVVEGQRSAT